MQSTSERNVLLNRIFHFELITGKVRSIYGGILFVNLRLFVSTTWDKMPRLGKIFIDKILKKTNH